MKVFTYHRNDRKQKGHLHELHYLRFHKSNDASLLPHETTAPIYYLLAVRDVQFL